MKTKKIFLMATMLLMSMCSFAQSGNGKPLKGDVNGDDVVDIADVVAVLKIMKDGGGTAETPVYYWYVGTTVPTDPTNSEQNTGLNKWTSLGTSLPTSSIKVAKSDDTNYAYHTWYIAAPTAANFTLYNASNGMSVETAWAKSTFNVGSIQYTLWTCKATSWQAVNYLHK